MDWLLIPFQTYTVSSTSTIPEQLTAQIVCSCNIHCCRSHHGCHCRN